MEKTTTTTTKNAVLKFVSANKNKLEQGFRPLKARIKKEKIDWLCR